MIAIKLVNVATVAGLALGAPAAARTQPTLTVTRKLPLTIVGKQFVPHETVHLAVSSGDDRRTESVRADGQGGFVARFTGLGLTPCGTRLTIRARAAETGLVSTSVASPVCVATGSAP